MKNTWENVIWKPNQDYAADTTKQKFKSSMITANPGSDKQNDRALINNSGNVTGDGNGSLHLNTYNFNMNYHACGSPVQFYYYPQFPPQPPLWSPSAYGKKRAVLMGISYIKRAPKLEGSVNNAQRMKYFLTHNLGFPCDSICMLTDDPEKQNRVPTKNNMRKAMRWLVEGCQPGDSLVFYFCGHGSRVKDKVKRLDMDEVDGYDEAICPVDYEDKGKILDDEINATIVRPLPCGAKLHAIVDACFSGTVLDLPFMCKMNRKGNYEWEDHRHPKACYKGTKGGLAICISACGDNGNAADKSALTYSFLQAMQDEPKLTYGHLLNAMRFINHWAKAGTFDLNGQVLAMDTWLQYAHEPQLSSSEMFDIYSESIAI
ncbi:metacaspase-3-like isoform X3 [Abrus precatorius]|uniref:Metacaspase-3-like isoform X3 n=1 Tax=Abrus precatorius TaxID=3816 RepID=A0A8B8K5V0_ABRPR|nr:metacaspase-3-like isoform X3 [Abrus precatorius]